MKLITMLCIITMAVLGIQTSANADDTLVKAIQNFIDSIENFPIDKQEESNFYAEYNGREIAQTWISENYQILKSTSDKEAIEILESAALEAQTTAQEANRIRHRLKSQADIIAQQITGIEAEVNRYKDTDIIKAGHLEAQLQNTIENKLTGLMREMVKTQMLVTALKAAAFEVATEAGRIKVQAE